MLSLIARNWWAVVLRGVMAILFGVLAWTWPGVTMGALILMWGAYCFADGVLAIVSAVSGSSGQPWWVLALEGGIGLGAAAVAFLYPGLTAIALVYLISAWAIATGILEIAAAIRLRAEIKGEFWLALAGLASVAFGLLLLAQPGVGVLAIVWMIGAYAFLFGVILIALGFHLRRFKGLGDRVARVAAAHR
jgi:uncharacterized membrane protein HdeD (DUF308 family)